MKALIFTRVSTKEQEDGQSIPAQVRRLTEYAIKRNFIIAQTFQVTESSNKSTRKEFDQVIAYIKKSKESYALIIDTIDRLQRSFRETPLLDALRKKGKIELHFLREGLIINQYANSSQLLQWDVGVLFASSYTRQLSDNVKRSQEQCVKNGQWVFSKPPYGYTNITLPTGKKDIQINPNQAPFVIKIFELYAQGNHSFNTIAIKMRAAGFPKTTRGRSITIRTVELIIKNPFYKGLMRIKGQLYPHKYPSIVSANLFDKVQNIIENHNKSPVQYAGKPILFRGLITCKKCGGSITGDIKKQRYVYYSCHNSKQICTKKWVKEEYLLSILLKYFDSICLSKEQINDILQYIIKYEKQAYKDKKKKLNQLNEQSAAVQGRISKLIDMHIDGSIDSHVYHFKLEEYNKEQHRLKTEIDAYQQTSNEDNFMAAQEVLELAKQAKDIFMSSSFDEKQQLLRFFFSNLTLNAENLDVELRKPLDLMQNSHDQHIWRG